MQIIRPSLRSLAGSIGVIVGTLSAGSAFAADYDITVTNITGGSYFTPVITAAHDTAARMF